MSRTNIKLNPQEITSVKTINSVYIDVSSMVLGHSVTLSCYLKSDPNTVVEVKHLRIEGEEYKNWGNDDSYLLNLVFTKLGITPSTTIENILNPVPGSELITPPVTDSTTSSPST
jgi:hypothetical protein